MGDGATVFAGGEGDEDRHLVVDITGNLSTLRLSVPLLHYEGWRPVAEELASIDDQRPVSGRQLGEWAVAGGE